MLLQAGAEKGVRGREGEGHCFEAGDFERECFALRMVGVAADGAESFLEEALLRRVGHFTLEGAQARAFGREHVVRGLEAGFFAGNVCVGDGFGACAERLPRGADGREAGEEGHEGDADDADAFEAGLGEGLLGWGVLVEVAPV